jgi:hypothetical protein
MIVARNAIEVSNARGAIERVGRLTDGLISLGPFGIGLDGLLTWIPFVGGAYSLLAGATLVGLGVRARVPVTTLIEVLAIVLVRSGVGEVPLAGQIAVDLFRGHKWAADLMVKAIDRTLYLDRADANGHDEALGAVRAGRERRRIVVLG